MLNYSLVKHYYYFLSNQNSVIVRLITPYSHQHLTIKKALQKYRYLLTSDSVVLKFVTPELMSVFSWAPSSTTSAPGDLAAK